jgi:ferredoxin-NADP reductase
MDVVLVRTHKENYNVQTFWFKPPEYLKYTAGQFIEMYLPHHNADERGQKHWFTLSSSPSEELISITTKYAGKTSSTFKQQLFALKEGAQVKNVEPMGDFVLPKDTSIPLVFVAGGIGVTPFRSMTKWLKDTGEKRSLQVLLAVNKPADALFVDVFQEYGVEPVILASQPDSKWRGETGRLSAQRIIDFIGDIRGKRIYVSGPEPMVETLEVDLHHLGVTMGQLVNDYFPGYKPDLT